MTDKPVAHYTIHDKGPNDNARGAFSAPYYTIASGDTLYSIGKRFGVSVAALQNVNDIANPNRISAGAKLVVPGSSDSNDDGDKGWSGHDKGPDDNARGTFSAPHYTIASGDSLTSIGERFGVSVAALQKVNRIANPNRISAGAKLVIPG